MPNDSIETENLFLEVEKIPPGSEALRIVNEKKEVRFVCITSPLSKKNGKFFWLGYGKLTYKTRQIFRNYLKDTQTSHVQFSRVKEGGSKVLLQDHSLKKHKAKALVSIGLLFFVALCIVLYMI